MSADHEVYGNEDQNTDMELIDSTAHPVEPTTHKDAEDYIEQYAAQVNQLRRNIAARSLNGEDAGDLILALAAAETELDKWIDIRVAHRNGEPLPF